MPSTHILYKNLNSLDEFSFIAGTDYYLNFTVYESDGVTPQNIGGATVTWMLSPYGESYNVLQIAGEVTGDSTFQVFIPASATENFSGKYLQQIKVVSFYSETFRPAQGIVMIAPQIPTN